MKWVFEGRVYSSLEELSGKTMSEGNNAEPVFSVQEMMGYFDYLNKPRFSVNGILTPLEFFSGNYISASNTVLVRFEDATKKNIVGEGSESESEL